MFLILYLFFSFFLFMVLYFLAVAASWNAGAACVLRSQPDRMAHPQLSHHYQLLTNSAIPIPPPPQKKTSVSLFFNYVSLDQ